MSREIKFRAWDEEKGIILYDDMEDYAFYHDGVNMTEVEMVNKILNYNMDNWDFGYFEFMQYIGVKDKNGKEIYEKDIVLIDGEDEYFVVEWDNDTARFVIASDTLVIDFDNCWGYQVEVIGNVYENADLLKEV